MGWLLMNNMWTTGLNSAAEENGMADVKIRIFKMSLLKLNVA